MNNEVWLASDFFCALLKGLGTFKMGILALAGYDGKRIPAKNKAFEKRSGFNTATMKKERR